ncbi:hypothetical protein TEQG_08574 [Trichophyton equinum CBS 127.97]|uniref:Uncharacterized protein n=1 Tax=Trichophyton equinum (strain ATCC MYA-4606 / CBS 127.97) TaxID=559882 RepID=F2PIM2_TRIEC|nr:hypothetical protein TEQG_08574 [Trichophyton equinum CBS 127.97]
MRCQPNVESNALRSLTSSSISPLHFLKEASSKHKFGSGHNTPYTYYKKGNSSLNNYIYSIYKDIFKNFSIDIIKLVKDSLYKISPSNLTSLGII